MSLPPPSPKVERKLRNRRKLVGSGGGRRIAVSHEVFHELNKIRNGRSHDCCLRRMLGMPTREGVLQSRIEGCLEVHTGMLILKMPETTWQDTEDVALKIADSVSTRKQVARRRPIRMREIL